MDSPPKVLVVQKDSPAGILYKEQLPIGGVGLVLRPPAELKLTIKSATIAGAL